MLCLSGFELYSRWVPLNNLLEANNIERMCMVIYHKFDKTVKMHINSH